MKNLITVIITDPKALPCVVQSLKQVSLHVEATTWCGRSGPIPKDGVLQVPDGRVCSKCEAALATYSKGAST
jgi:hypothetical protein